MFLRFFYFLILFFNFPFLFSTEINFVEIFFRKIVRENEKEIDKVEGILYFTGEERIFVRVTKPINQIVVFAKFTNIFYYPDEKSAVIITYSKPNILPMKMQFDIFARDDMGLGEAGYKLENSYKSNNILVGVWVPPEKYKRELGKVEIGHGKKNILFNRVFSPKGELLIVTEFIEFTEVKGRKIPLHIKTTSFYDKKKREEEMIYSLPKIDIKIADEILNFEIPSDAKIKTVEW